MRLGKQPVIKRSLGFGKGQPVELIGHHETFLPGGFAAELQSMLGNGFVLCRLLGGGSQLRQHRHFEYVGIGMERLGHCVNRLKGGRSIVRLGSNVFRTPQHDETAGRIVLCYTGSSDQSLGQGLLLRLHGKSLPRIGGTRWRLLARREFWPGIEMRGCGQTDADVRRRQRESGLILRARAQVLRQQYGEQRGNQRHQD
ncbi:MAG: hypothetical protein WAU84_15815 [Thermoguttaceae bacterium]